MNNFMRVKSGCPFCKHRNNTPVEKPVGTKLIYCDDPQDGGCNKQYIITWHVIINVAVGTIQYKNIPEDIFPGQ